MTRSEHPSDPLREQMHDLLDGRLSTADADRVRARIAADENLTREYGELSRLVGDLSALREDSAPRRFRDSVIRAVSAESAARTSGPRRWLRIVVPIAAAAALSATALLIHRAGTPTAKETVRESELAQLESKDLDGSLGAAKSNDLPESTGANAPVQPEAQASTEKRAAIDSKESTKESPSDGEVRSHKGAEPEGSVHPARGATGGGGGGQPAAKASGGAANKDSKVGDRSGQKPGKDKAASATAHPSGAASPTGGSPKAPGTKSPPAPGSPSPSGKSEDDAKSDGAKLLDSGGEFESAMANDKAVAGLAMNAGSGIPRLLRVRSTVKYKSNEVAGAHDDERIGGLLKAKNELGTIITNDAEIERAIAALPEAAREAVVAARKRAPNRVHFVALTETESEALVANAKKAQKEIDEFVADESKADEVSRKRGQEAGSTGAEPTWRSVGESAKKNTGDGGAAKPATGAGKKAGEPKSGASDPTLKKVASPTKANDPAPPARRLVIVIDES